MIWRKKILVRENFSFFHSVRYKNLLSAEKNSVKSMFSILHNISCWKIDFTEFLLFQIWSKINSSLLFVHYNDVGLEKLWKCFFVISQGIFFKQHSLSFIHLSKFSRVFIESTHIKLKHFPLAWGETSHFGK